MSLGLQILISGAAAGSLYGLVAVVHTLVYRLTGVVQFALGDMIGVAAFSALVVAAGTGAVAQEHVSPWRFALALAVAFLVAAAIGVIGYVGAVAPFLERGSVLGWIAATAALAFALNALLETLFGRPGYVMPDPFPFDRLGDDGLVTVAGATLRARDVFVVILGLAVAAGASLVLRRTRSGHALEAIASDLEAARVVGLPVERLVTAAFALAGALAATVAVVAGPGEPIDASTGALLGLKGLAAALAVGFGSFWRAFAAGVVLGLAEATIATASVGGLDLGASYREVLPLAAALVLAAVVAARRPREVA